MLLKNCVIFTWSPNSETAFQVLMQAIISALLLALQDFKEQFVINTDACDVGIGFVLS
jgi:hypothetical protein